MDSEETKQELMTYAIDLLDYAEKIPVIDSKKDFVTALNPEVDLGHFGPLVNNGDVQHMISKGKV